MIQTEKDNDPTVNPAGTHELTEKLGAEALPSRLGLAHPKIYLSKALNTGQSIVAASHAALAWHL